MSDLLVVEYAADFLSVNPPLWPQEVYAPKKLNSETATPWFNAAALEAVRLKPAEFHGRGITICAGGMKYLPSAYVCIRTLRTMGCVLPIQLWYLGRKEFPEVFDGLFDGLGVDCIDASLVRRTRPSRILNGWEVKPFAIKFKICRSNRPRCRLPTSQRPVGSF